MGEGRGGCVCTKDLPLRPQFLPLGKTPRPKQRTSVQCAAPAGVSRNGATPAWLRNQTLGAEQEFALEKLLLSPLALRAPCLLDRGPAKERSWARPAGQPMTALLGSDQGWEGPGNPVRCPALGRTPGGQVSAAPIS